MATVRSVEELKSLIDPIAVYQDYVRLTRRGRRSLGLCPFHKEKTPSFSVDGDNGLFYCFGCHKGGDVLHFLQEMESCDFREAAEILARKAGVTMEFGHGTPRDQAPDRKERLRSLLEAAQGSFRKALEEAPPGSQVRRYCERRGIRPETAEALGLGFARPSGDLLAHLSRMGFKADEALEAGLVVDRGGGAWAERFRNRLTFPIRDVMGRTVGFGGRALGDEEPKYLNSPESPVFQKRDVLYGLSLTKQAVRGAEQILLVEGYMDFLSAYQAGVTNVAATLGTALADGQVRLVKRYAREVVLGFDQDAAGLEAAKRAILLLLAEDLKIKVVVVPDGKDPDEFIGQHGPEAYRKLLEGAAPFFDFLVEAAERTVPSKDAAGKRAVTDRMAEYLGAVANPIERQEYAARVAGRLGIEPSLVLRSVAASQSHGKAAPVTAAAAEEAVPVAEQILLKGALAFPEACRKVMSGLEPALVDGLVTGRLLRAVLEGRTEGASDQSRLLASIQHGCHEVPTEKDMEQAAARLRIMYLRTKERQVIQQIKEASQKHDDSLIGILLRERSSLAEHIYALERSNTTRA